MSSPSIASNSQVRCQRTQQLPLLPGDSCQPWKPFESSHMRSFTLPPSSATPLSAGVLTGLTRCTSYCIERLYHPSSSSAEGPQNALMVSILCRRATFLLRCCSRMEFHFPYPCNTPATGQNLQTAQGWQAMFSHSRQTANPGNATGDLVCHRLMWTFPYENSSIMGPLACRLGQNYPVRRQLQSLWICAHKLLA